MALGIRRNASAPAQKPKPTVASPPAELANWKLPADWREQLTATPPKGRFRYGENIGKR